MINLKTSNGAVSFSIDPQGQKVSASFQDPSKSLAVACAGDLGGVDGEILAYLRDVDQTMTRGGQVDPNSLGNHHLQRLPGRMGLAMYYLGPRLKQVAEWLVGSRETTNFTYDLTERNLNYLAHFVTAVTGVSPTTALGYLQEPAADAALTHYLRTANQSGVHRIVSDDQPRFGRRLGWYAIVRAKKPAIVIETGVDKGLGSVLLCAAVRRNVAEGHPGVYYGTDINPAAGFLLGGEYARYGQILYGDSIETLTRFDKPIDVFINDSDHSAEYEWREYLVVRSKLAEGAVVLGDNSHSTDALMRFAALSDRRFLFFREEPRDHWYPGAGIGAAF